MQTKIVLYVVAAVVVVGAGYLVFSKMGANGSGPVMSAASQPTTLRELASQMEPQKCTFTSAEQGSGTMYVANGKVRGDFSYTMQGQAMAGHLIVQDNTSYLWMEGATQGLKTSFEAEASSSAEGSISPDEKVQYACAPWSPDENQFVLPAGVTFGAASAIEAETGVSGSASQCAACDQVPESSRAQCKAALHC